MRTPPCAELKLADGWQDDIFRLGPLMVERHERQVWFDGVAVRLPPGALFFVLLALCEAWSESLDCSPLVRLGTLIRVDGNKPHRVDYDDIHRLRMSLPSRGIVECVRGVGYRLVRVSWPPRGRHMQRSPSGERRR